ncbi:MAG: type II toxin-antitoxin system RelE/ParE family toxin [Planctomycetaceae bacterium]|nr:type II toxin-antitoxin system RelE/ParE family toxin [Planctomycetaceae bacterium]
MEIVKTEAYSHWFDQLKDNSIKDKIAARIYRLETHGHSGDAKSVGNGVSEIRIHSGPGYRIYYTQRGNTIVILLCGGDKSSQQKDIDKAQQLAKELQ